MNGTDLHSHSTGDVWDRIAHELHRCKQAQSLAWGNVDNATLARYLAGEISGEELAGVEEQLGRHPELRKLTELVRDVLGEVGPVEEGIERGTPSPLLSFEQVRRRRTGFVGMLRRRSSVLAAACLLIILAAATPGTRLLNGPSESPAILGDAVAMRGAVPRMPENGFAMAAMVAPAGNAPGLAMKQVAEQRDEGMRWEELPGADLTAQQAVRLHKQGVWYRHQGDVERAEGSLRQAHLYCKRKLGSEHPITQSSARYLAEVYTVALNAPSEGEGSITGLRSGLPQPAVVREPENSKGKLRERLADQRVSQIRSQVVPVLVQALQRSTELEQRLAYTRALGELGPAAQEAVPVLIGRLEQAEEGSEIREVLLALEKLGEAARPAIGQVRSYALAVRTEEGREPRKGKKFFKVPGGLGEEERKLAGRVLSRLKSSEGRVGIRDLAGCLTLRTVRMGAQQLHQLARESQVEVLIETGDAERAGSALEQMGKKALHIVLDPQEVRVQIRGSEAFQGQKASLERIREVMQQAWEKQEYDRALREGLKTIRDVVRPSR